MAERRAMHLFVLAIELNYLWILFQFLEKKLSYYFILCNFEQLKCEKCLNIKSIGISRDMANEKNVHLFNYTDKRLQWIRVLWKILSSVKKCVLIHKHFSSICSTFPFIFYCDSVQCTYNTLLNTSNYFLVMCTATPFSLVFATREKDMYIKQIATKLLLYPDLPSWKYSFHSDSHFCR